VSALQVPTGGEIDDNNAQIMGDFNGDGKKDIALVVQNYVSSTWTSSISVVLSNGDGTFQAPQLTATPGNVDDPIVVGDVNGDGKDDILMVHPGNAPSTFDVLISNGDGTFTVGNNYVVSAAGLNGGLLTDSNGDGKLDVVVIDGESPALEIALLGNGDGTFQPAITLTTLTGAAPNSINFADFNGDGKLDFEGRVGNQVSVYLASGTDFLAPVALTTSDSVYDSCNEAVGDLNGDGKPEIVSSNCYDNNLTVFVNNGDGSFQTGVYYGAGLNALTSTNASLYPYAATIADVNGDGKNDIVSSNDDGGDVTILLGSGDGTVTVPTIGFATGGYPYTPAFVADFNGDGLADIMVSDDIFSMAFLRGYGDGTFRAALDYYSPTANNHYDYSIGIATGDFNGDGLADFVVGQEGDSTLGITVFLSNSDGSMQSGVNYGAGGQMYYVTVADLNGDGKLDIVSVDDSAGVVQVFTGNGDGTFVQGSTFATDTAGGPYPQGLVAGDFNHDGKADVAVLNSNNYNVGILLGDGNGGFGTPTTYPISQYAYDLTAADLNGDGFLDVAVPLDNTGNVAIFMANNDSSGTFQPESDAAFGGQYLRGIAAGDLNGDGKVDLAVTSDDNLGNGIMVALGNGDGTFQAAAGYASTLQNFSIWDPYTSYIRMLDLDADGKLDLIYTNAEYGTVAVMQGNGDGTFSSPIEFPVGGFGWDIAVADVNGDGATDVVTADDDMSGVTVLLNANGSGTQPNFTVSTTANTLTVTAGASGTVNLNLTGKNGYTGTVTFSCSGLPAKSVCAFNPPSVMAQGNLTVSTVLTITTTAAMADLFRPALPNSNPAAPTFLASLSGLGLFGMVFAGGKKRTRRQKALLLGILLLVMGFSLIGCSGGSSTSGGGGTPGTPVGNYAVVVTSTGSGNGAPTHTVNLTLTVQ
jgi:hypothetical protein